MTVLKKTLVALVGGSLLLAGLLMLVLPGPAFVVVPAALAILAIEFVWARRWLAWLRERLKAFAADKSPSKSAGNLNPQIASQIQGLDGHKPDAVEAATWPKGLLASPSSPGRLANRCKRHFVRN